MSVVKNEEGVRLEVSDYGRRVALRLSTGAVSIEGTFTPTEAMEIARALRSWAVAFGVG